MAKRSNNGAGALFEHLCSIYGDQAAGTLIQGIGDLCRRHADIMVETPARERLSEKDVLLITYGDTLNESGTPPLRVLQRFCHDYLDGVFELVHILPFHPYSSDDGFSVIDYHAVRKDLGSWDDIASIARDCRVMADAVINHMSSESGWFKEFLANDPDYAGFFFECDPAADLSAVVRPRTSPLLTVFQDADGLDRHVWTTFSADQVDLDYRNPQVLLAVIDVLFSLIARGARLLRLDAVTFLWKEPGTSSANLEETHRLIKIMRSAVSMLRKDVVVITETNVPHRENIAYFGDGYDEAHMVYNFALPPLLAHSFIQGDSMRLNEWARQLSLPSDEVCFLNFSASHDGVGVRPVEEILDAAELHQLVDASVAAKGLVSSRTAGDGQEHPYELNCTFLDLIAAPDDDVNTLASRFIASQAIVLMMPGVPAIYIQSLLGTRNDLECVRQTGRARSINRSRHDYAEVRANLANPGGLESTVFTGLKRLIGLRRRQSAFDPFAPFAIVDLGREVFAIRRGPASQSATMLCVVNLTGDVVTVDIPPDDAGRDLLSGDTVMAGNHELPAFAVRWLRREQQ